MKMPIKLDTCGQLEAMQPKLDDSSIDRANFDQCMSELKLLSPSTLRKASLAVLETKKLRLENFSSDNDDDVTRATNTTNTTNITLADKNNLTVNSEYNDDDEENYYL